MKYTAQKEARIPFVSPILSILKSRRVMLLLVNLIVVGLVTQFPQLEPLADTIMLDVFVIGSLIVISGLSIEDALAINNETKGTLPDTVQENIREIVDEVIKDVTKDNWDG